VDRQGLLNPDDLWNRRGAWLAGVLAACAVVGFHYLYVEQMLAALALFTAVWLPLLSLAFLIALAERAGEIGLARLWRALRTLPEAAWYGFRPAQWAGISKRMAKSSFLWSGRKPAPADACPVSQIDRAGRRFGHAGVHGFPHGRRAA
jgi:hypothetical protein